MTEEQIREMRAFLDNLKMLHESGNITTLELCRAVIVRGGSIKEFVASSSLGAERGIKGYDQLCDSVGRSTFDTMCQVLFEGRFNPGFNPGTTILKLHDEGRSNDGIMDYFLKNNLKNNSENNSKNNSKDADAKRREEAIEVMREALPFIIEARKYDREHVDLAYEYASETIKGNKIAEPDPDIFGMQLAACGISVESEPKADREEDTRDLLAERSLAKLYLTSDLPRWARCLVKRPGITPEEKKKIEDTWKRDKEGKEEVFEMFFRAIEQADPSYLDVRTIDDYAKNFRTLDYIGGLAFDREMALADYKTQGFSMSEERLANLNTVGKCLTDIQNKFNKGLTIKEHPRFKYIKDPEKVTSDQAVALIGMATAMEADENDTVGQNERKDAIYFANELLSYAICTVSDTAKARGILTFNKQYTGEERVRIINDWYAQFKETMVSQGIDLDDPVAMGRIRALVPGQDVEMYMPAMKGLDEDYIAADEPLRPGIDWYKGNLNSANGLSMDQKTSLYELAREGKLLFCGKDMAENSLCCVYNDVSGKPQLSRPLIDVNIGSLYPDEEALARELFPDAVHPFRVYKEACALHTANRNQIPMTVNKDGSMDFNYDKAADIAYGRVLFRDYYEHPDKYNGTPEDARDREAQVYTLCKYDTSVDEDFRDKYKEYVENNGIDFESDNVILTDQQKAIRSINNPALSLMKVPKLTREMLDFVNSINSVMHENGFDMGSYQNKASLRIFTDKNGLIKEVPTCANFDLKSGPAGYTYVGTRSNMDNDRLNPIEKYVYRNDQNLGWNTDSVLKKGLSAEETIRIALIYESAKKGQLLFTKPGDPTSASIPLVPGEDGKAKLITDFDSLGDDERKKDYYVNASRVRRSFRDPNEKAKREFLRENASKIDNSIYSLTFSSMDMVATSAVRQADAKGIKGKKQFIEQVMALTPEVDSSFSDFVERGSRERVDDGDEPIRFKPNRIKAKKMAARKELSRKARENFFDTKYEANYFNRFTSEAVKRGLITEEEAKKIMAKRGLEAIFYDRGDKPETLEANVKAAVVLAKGSVEEKTLLYNQRLEKFNSFDSSEYYDISDAELVDKWPEIDDKMYRLQELIKINGELKAAGIIGDENKLNKAMMAERGSGDIYFHLSNRLQAIANPAYETVDVDQLMNLDGNTLDDICNININNTGRELCRLANSVKTAKNGMQLAAQTYIANQFIDTFGAKDGRLDYYNKEGIALNPFQVADQLLKGNEIYAAHADEDLVYAFKAPKGSFKAELQPSEKYAKRISSLTEMRKELRLAKEEKQLERDFAEFKREVEANEKRIATIRAERANRKETVTEYDGEALNALFDGYPSEEPVAEAKPELDVLRDRLQADIKEEIEYEQYQLSLIIDSYGPNGLYRDHADDYKTFTTDSAASIIALSKVLEESNKGDIAKADLEKLCSKEHIAAVKAELLEDEGFKLTVKELSTKDGSVDTKKFLAIAASDKTIGEKLQAAADLRDLSKNKAAVAKAEKEKAYKKQAREVLRSGVGKYKEFSKALDELLDYGQYKLGASGNSIKLKNPGVKDIAKSCLAEVFATLTVKDIIDSKNMTYKQTESLCSPKALKSASKEIMSDPAFVEFFDELAKHPDTLIAVGKQNKDESFNRDSIRDMFKSYSAKHKDMVKGKEEKVKVEEIKAPVKVKVDDLSAH